MSQEQKIFEKSVLRWTMFDCCFGGFLAAINCQRPAEDAKKSTSRLTFPDSRNLEHDRFRGCVDSVDLPSAAAVDKASAWEGGWTRQMDADGQTGCVEIKASLAG